MAKPTFSVAETRHARLTDVAPIVPGAIVSKGILDTDGTRQVLFALDEGQQLSEHTAANPATVHVLSGRLRFSLPACPPDCPPDRDMGPGDWLLLKAAEPHSLVALEPTHFLLTLLKK